MKRMLFMLPLVLCAQIASAQVPATFSNRAPDSQQIRPRPPTTTIPQKDATHPLVGGEDIPTAKVIPGVPYSDAGNTCNALNDYEFPCGLTGAPDVVYSYTPATDECIGISLCRGTTYDSGLYVYQNSPATVVACNNDGCGFHGGPSVLLHVDLVAGNTYYIVVDGYSAVDCGNYTIDVTPCCIVPCPAGSIAEGEPGCGSGYVDTYDAGCNSDPPSFRDLQCGSTPIVVCGMYGTYRDPNFIQFRDTDWYRIALTQPTQVDCELNGEAASQLALLDANAGCAGVFPYCNNFTGPCTPVQCGAPLMPGTYWILAAPATFTDIPCGSKYTLKVTCSPIATPTQAATWGGIKAHYR